MRSFLQKNHRLVFYGLWLLLGLLQSGLTELQDDEAYYWVFSQYLDWGYFDHPPMTALLIKMGYAIFPNELGVRLFPLLLNIFSLVIIEQLIDKKNPLLFYAIALSMAVIQIAGFIAVPDNPLIFFTALFFLFYKKFLNKSSLFNAVLLGLSIAFLLYSKYHAVLIVLFVLLSNLKLFTRYHIYVAGIISLLLFAPHIWWQYQHDWVSFRYHLFESNVNAYKPSFTLDYILGQFLLPGPIAGFILLTAAIVYKTKNDTEKALKYMMAGVYLFFLLSSFRGKVEANWTSPALVAVIVLSHQYLLEKIRWQKWLFKLLPITLILVLLVRIITIEDMVPVKAVKERYHSWKSWPKEMYKRTEGLPIVFSNSYQRASKYWFYSGQMTYSLNQYKERRNNYNFWPIEDSLLGKPVYFLDKHGLWRFNDSLETPIGWVGYKYDSAFSSFAKVQIIPTSKKLHLTYIGMATQFDAVATMSPMYRSYILKHPGLQAKIIVGVFNEKGWIEDYPTTLTLQDLLKDKFSIRIDSFHLKEGTYYLRFAIESDGYAPTHNSDKIELIVGDSG